MTGTLCLSGPVAAKAGIHCNLTPADATWTGWIEAAEGAIMMDDKVDWVTGYAGLGTAIKAGLSDRCSSLAAMDAIANDTTGYLSREADMLMNKNLDRASKLSTNFKDIKGKGNIKTAS